MLEKFNAINPMFQIVLMWLGVWKCWNLLCAMEKYIERNQMTETEKPLCLACWYADCRCGKAPQPKPEDAV